MGKDLEVFAFQSETQNTYPSFFFHMEGWKGSLLPLDAKISGSCSPSYCFCFFLRLDLIILPIPDCFFVAVVRDNVTASEIPFCIYYSSRLDHFSSRLQLQLQSFDSQTDPSCHRQDLASHRRDAR